MWMINARRIVLIVIDRNILPSLVLSSGPSTHREWRKVFSKKGKDDEDGFSRENLLSGKELG